MIINNQNRAAWIKFCYYLLTFLYLAGIVLLLYLNFENNYLIIGIISIVFLITIVFSLYLNLNFIIFKEADQKIILRYYPLHPFHDNFKSIEIINNTLSHFELNSKVFGLKSELTLFQKTEKGIARYPKVYLSALTKKERDKIIECLTKYDSTKV